MAITLSNKKVFSVGNVRQMIAEAETTAASGVIDTGLSYVYQIFITPKSMATASLTLKQNLGSGATAVNGRVNINSAAVGDTFFITCFGK